MSCCGVYLMPYEPQAPVLRAPRKITGRFVLVAFILFFGTIGAVNGVMMTLAFQTMPGLDVRNGYDASQRYNGEISAMRDQATRGWAADVGLILRGTDAPVSVMLADAGGQPVNGLELSARLSHPADRKIDHEIKLVQAPDGSYRGNFANVTRGAWDISVDARRGDTRVYTSRSRVFLTEK